MPKMAQEVIDARIRFARSVKWDYKACSREWRISLVGARYFIQEFRPRRRIVRPEYENQRLFDLQVMSPKQWCEVWGIPRWEYNGFLKMYERKHGKLATPERRAKWESEYWEKLE